MSHDAVSRTDVLVVGAGPAGLTLANILTRRGIGCVVLEAQSRTHIETYARAGFLEEWAVRELDRHGLADRLLGTAQRQGEFEFRFDGERHTVRYAELTGHHHFIYPQQKLVADLVAGYADDQGGDIRFGVRDVELHDLESAAPHVTYTDPDSGERRRVDCAFVAGCDGARGVSSSHVPADRAVVARHDYGVGWLALLAETPPSADGVIFGIHPRGFAAHMARTPEITRFYLQCAPGDDAGRWSEERIWRELRTRLAVPGGPIKEGRVIDKQVLDMHNHVMEPMSYGRLHLAGESAHLVAPIGAKGMNLALHDAFLLADALTARLRDGDGRALTRYSAEALRRVWQYQEFSQWFAELLHGPGHDRTAAGREERGADGGAETAEGAASDLFRARLARARILRMLGSPVAATAFCELYIGKAADF